MGCSDELEATARNLGHPCSAVFRNMRVFRGLEQGIYEDLAMGILPKNSSHNRRLPAVSHSGFLPVLEGRPRGIFSYLSDGSFLSVEWCEEPD